MSSEVESDVDFGDIEAEPDFGDLEQEPDFGDDPDYKEPTERDALRAHSHFTMLPDAILDDRRVSRRALNAYEALRRHTSREGTCFPSVARLALFTRTSERSVQYGIRDLMRLGILEVSQTVTEAGRPSVNQYTLYDCLRGAGGAPLETDSVLRGAGGAPLNTRGATVAPPGVHVVHPKYLLGEVKEGGPTPTSYLNATRARARPSGQPPPSASPQDQEPERTPQEILGMARKIYVDARGMDLTLTPEHELHLVGLAKAQTPARILAALRAWCELAKGKPIRFFLEADWRQYLPPPPRDPRTGKPDRDRPDCPNCGELYVPGRTHSCPQRDPSIALALQDVLRPRGIRRTPEEEST